ncbi:Ribonuclease H domain [Arabidopsis suecica]|uniref:Ribonuclease H superfamily polynucleotidyl transferase n=2 Tax=Arabidopsis TaxID=3701 RepID=Q3ECT2_ARATH|nr:ribonuclease H superfamily polynucleotidyl transferase [Arabidopsis thaliana]AEE32520.1 ribonuclease H superfamily polynucleotidyl transferase [Arabidopsis thaliana]KAG7657020.1 Ribonuclease H domain [Arabidopsis suecica]|eukprot:NP_175435.1 ribonuclease H superfamily polynucleotidyl transferase [Arabidopsis thaliana]
MNNKKINFGCCNWTRDAMKWRQRFEAADVTWVSRTNNGPADLLAKHRLPDNCSFQYHYYVPPFIVSALHCNHS